MNRSKTVTEVVGIILVVLTVLLFFIITKERAPVQWWGLGFMLFAEIVTMVGLLRLPDQHRDNYRPMQVSGTYASLLGYQAVAIVVALVYMVAQPEKVTGLVAIQLALAALVLIVLVVLNHFSGAVGAGIQETQQVAAAMQNLTGQAALLYKNPAYTQYARALEKLYEALRFSDHALTVAVDQQIVTGIGNLEKLLAAELNNECAVQEQIDDLIQLVQRRRQQAQELQRGKI